jgi:hypothetical protein
MLLAEGLRGVGHGAQLMAAGLLARLNYHSPDGRVTEVQYWTSTFCLYAIGYPLASTLSYGLLSKVRARCICILCACLCVHVCLWVCAYMSVSLLDVRWLFLCE